MNNINKSRIALILPTVELGAYWQPVLDELAKLSEKVVLYTGRPWPGFDSQILDNSVVQVVGKTKRLTINKDKSDYGGGLMYLSLGIVRYLFQFKPDVIIASGFSVWTLLALLLKPVGKWRLVIAWEGSSPSVDFRNSKVRLLFRSIMASFADALITNTYAGKDYLIKFLGVKEDKIRARPYMVPDIKTLLQTLRSSDAKCIDSWRKQPVFLYVGRIEQRKGLHQLLQACSILKKQGHYNYTLLVVGKGPQQEELESLCQAEDLQDCVKWIGWIDYSSLGLYFSNADVFVFPTLEDTWGMVVLEAMAFGKPILCSKWAGTSEVLVDRENGYVFDPHHPETLAEAMKTLIDNPKLISSMGQKSQQLISEHTPEAAAKFFVDIAFLVSQR
ncbi:MAG: glycosyltransferase family 4 protein [Gloeotrichia echinulata CP02]|jgi:glycosyltransferase involved in cell wall biosynthesis